MRQPIRIEGDVAFVTLTKGHVAIFDAADIGIVADRKWYAVMDRNKVYAATKTGSDNHSTLLMHRLIMNCRRGIMIDHRDGDGLNNRRSNLREADHSQNGRNQGPGNQNTSGFKGVSFIKRSSRWKAAITVYKKRHYLGSFKTPEEAYAAYCSACVAMHGEFARTK